MVLISKLKNVKVAQMARWGKNKVEYLLQNAQKDSPKTQKQKDIDNNGTGHVSWGRGQHIFK